VAQTREIRARFRQTMTGLPPMHPMALNFAVLGGWLVVCLILAVRLWRWE